MPAAVTSALLLHRWLQGNRDKASFRHSSRRHCCCDSLRQVVAGVAPGSAIQFFSASSQRHFCRRSGHSCRCCWLQVLRSKLWHRTGGTAVAAAGDTVRRCGWREVCAASLWRISRRHCRGCRWRHCCRSSQRDGLRCKLTAPQSAVLLHRRIRRCSVHCGRHCAPCGLTMTSRSCRPHRRRGHKMTSSS